MINDKPGPELDVKVAATLFGWHYGPYHPELPQYSTTWNGMQLVVEEMRRRGYSLCINTVDHNSAAFINGEAELGTWHSNVKSLDKVNYRAHADTAPHAVCKATLKALEDDRD